jgi:hypothetical protein
VLSLIGWLACAAGTVVAFLAAPGRPAVPAVPTGALARPRGSALGPVILVVLAGLGVAAAFAPAWDSFTLRTAAGQVQTVTAGNAFSNPGLVIAGDVFVMIVFAAAAIAAALWRPARHGAVLLAGAAIPMVAQAISAIVQVGATPGPTQFGIPAATARQLGITISAGLTPAFWIYVGFLIALVVSCAWMLFIPQPALVTPGDGWNGPRPGAPDGQEPGEAPAPEAGTPEASHTAASDHAAAGARDGDSPG